MSRKTTETIVIDRDLKSYEGFFDFEWCRNTTEAAKGTPLERPVDLLMMSWRSANGAHRLPILMVESLRSFANGEIMGSLRAWGTHSEKFFRAIVERIDQRMKTRLSPEQLFDLNRSVRNIGKEDEDKLRATTSQVDLDILAYWRHLTELSEFQFSILGSQRTNYSSIFFAYEDFLANLIRIKEPSFRAKPGKMDKTLPTKNGIGKDLAQFCWLDSEIDLAKKVRNSLAHNGGRYTTEIHQLYDNRFVSSPRDVAVLPEERLFVLVGDTIQITPRNNKHLFRILSERVTRVVSGLKDRFPPSQSEHERGIGQHST